MNEQQDKSQVSNSGVPHEQCLCYQFLDHIRDYLGVSPAVKQHLVSSRIEFLKAIREMIDSRIEHLSTKAQQGTKIAIE